jgi:hypothetical protein
MNKNSVNTRTINLSLTTNSAPTFSSVERRHWHTLLDVAIDRLAANEHSTDTLDQLERLDSIVVGDTHPMALELIENAWRSQQR